MADIFLQSIKEIQRRAQDNVLIFSDVLSERLDELANAMIDAKMSDNDYIKLCEVFFLRYKKEQNEKGMVFCLLRMQQLIQYKKKTRFQSMFPKLQFSLHIDEETKEFLTEKKYFYRISNRAFQKKVLVFDLIFVLAILYAMVLLLHISFFRAWFISLGIGLIIYLLGIFYVFDRVLEQNIESMRKCIHKSHASVDASIQRE
ncbi:hypothetical protein [Floccifex sp.]|uniref:hypothetical protein n=1 Tax=Floccifex sp. TaxID=2815810 RepID=UPI003F0B658E